MKQLSGIDWNLRRGTCLVPQMDGAAVDWRLKCGGLQSRPIKERCGLSFIQCVSSVPLPVFLFLLFMKVCLCLSLHDHVSPSTGDRRHLLCSLAVIICSKTHWLTLRQTFGREEKRSMEGVRWFKHDGIRKHRRERVSKWEETEEEKKMSYVHWCRLMHYSLLYAILYICRLWLHILQQGWVLLRTWHNSKSVPQVMIWFDISYSIFINTLWYQFNNVHRRQQYQDYLSPITQILIIYHFATTAVCSNARKMTSMSSGRRRGAIAPKLISKTHSRKTVACL